MCESIWAKADHAVLNPHGQVFIPLLTLGIGSVGNPTDFVALLDMNKGIKIQATNRKDFSFVREGLEIFAAEKNHFIVLGFLNLLSIHSFESECFTFISLTSDSVRLIFSYCALTQGP